MMSPNILAFRPRSPPLREKQPTPAFYQLPIPGHLRPLQTSRPNNGLVEPASYDLGALWSNLAAPLGCLETAPDFISEFLNLPPQETCESLNSHCARRSSGGDPSEGVPNSPQSRGTLLESWPSGASLTGLDLTEVVESTGSPVARAMDRSTGEDDPPIDQPISQAGEASFNFSDLFQASSTQGWDQLTAGNPLATAGAETAAATLEAPSLSAQQAEATGRRAANIEFPNPPAWQNPPPAVPSFLWRPPTELIGEEAPSTGQQPTFPSSSLDFSQPQRLDLPSPDLVGSLLGHLPGTYDSFVAPQPSAEVNPNLATYDLREGLVARPAPADSDDVYRRLLLTLLSGGGATGSSFPLLAANPPLPLGRATSVPEPPRYNPSFLTSSLPDPLLEFPLRWASEMAALRAGPHPGRAQPGTEVSTGAQLASGSQPGGLLRVSSVPIARPRPSALTVPAVPVSLAFPVSDSPGDQSAVLAPLEDSPASETPVNPPPKKGTKRPAGNRKRPVQKKAAATDQDPNPVPNPVSDPFLNQDLGSNPVANPAQTPAQNAPQMPAANPGLSRRASPKRTPEAAEGMVPEGGGQGTWRPVKRSRDVSPSKGTMSQSTSGGASVAGSLNLTPPPVPEPEAPTERNEATTQRRRERRERLRELRTKACGCTQDWPNDVQELRASCNEQAKEIHSLNLQREMMNRRDSHQTQRIDELAQKVRDLEHHLKRARQGGGS